MAITVASVAYTLLSLGLALFAWQFTRKIDIIVQ